MTPPSNDETESCLQIDNVVMETRRSWVVCGALSIMYLLAYGYQQVFGIFFVAFQSEFESSASVTASIMAVYAVNYSVMSLVSCNVLIKRLQARTITLTGGIIVSVGVALGTFAESIGYLMVTNGVILGIGSAFIFGPAVVTVGQYFEKRKTIATTIVTAGTSVGGMVLPPLARLLLDEYDVRGAMLIFGALLLHVIPAALLLRPRKSRHFEINREMIKSEKKALLKENDHFKQKDDIYKSELNNLSDSTSLPHRIKEFNGVNIFSDSSFHSKNYTSLPGNLNEYNTVVPEELIKTYPDQLKSPVIPPSTNLKENLKEAVNPFSDIFSGYKNYTSLPENLDEYNTLVPAELIKTYPHQFKIPVIAPSTNIKDNSKEAVYPFPDTSLEGKNPATLLDNPGQNKGTVVPSSQHFKEKLKERLRHAVDPSLFKTPMFYIFLGFHAFASTGIVVFSTFLPPIGKDNGLTDGQCAVLVSLYAGLDLLCRFSIAYISDRNWMKRYRLLAGCFVILGTMYHLVRFSSFTLMILFVVVFGLFSGAFYSLHPIIAVDFLGKDKFHTVFGYVQFIHGMVRIVAFPVVGALRDFTGNYVASCHYLATSLYISAIFLMIKPLVTRTTNSSITT